MECKSNIHTYLLTAKGGITHEKNHRPRYRSPWHHRISVSGIRRRYSLGLDLDTTNKDFLQVRSPDGFQSCCQDLQAGEVTDIAATIRWYVGFWIFLAVVLLSYLLVDALEATSNVVIWGDQSGGLNISMFALFLMLLIFAESKPVPLPGLSGSVFITVTFLIAMAAIIRLQPIEVALASSLAAMSPLPGGGKNELVKRLFNAAQSASAAGAAALTYRALGGLPDVSSVPVTQLILATGAATAVYFLINSIAVSGVISLSSRRPFVETWVKTHGWLAATYTAFGATGLVLAALFESAGWYSLPLLMFPLFIARQVFRAYDEVSDAYVETVRAFVSAIEAKDTYTRGHSERVAEYSLMIARKMGVKEEALEVFHFGALLHDVGKLIVRKAVLTKPSRLEEAEFDEIKRHPVVGAQIVQEIEFLRPALDAVLYHHERLDGSGYPAGLVGDIVPPWARMMAVADTYDAMTSTRAYRGARTHDEAMEELHRCSGTQFDPICISAFEEAIEELRELERQTELHEAQVVPRIAG